MTGTRATSSKGHPLIGTIRPPRTRLVGWAIALLLISTRPGVADGPRGAEWIASDAVAYVEVARTSDLLARATGDPLRGLLADSPQYRDYLDSDAYRHFRGVLDAVTGPLGTTWDKA